MAIQKLIVPKPVETNCNFIRYTCNAIMIDITKNHTLLKYIDLLAYSNIQIILDDLYSNVLAR